MYLTVSTEMVWASKINEYWTLANDSVLFCGTDKGE